MATPKFVRYIGKEEYGLKHGDIVKVLSGTNCNCLYVECPKKTSYSGDSATNPENLKGKNFNLINKDEYELVEESKSSNTPKYVKFIGSGDGDGAGLKYGDIVEVLSTNRSLNDFLYVKTPLQSTQYGGDNATNKMALVGENFTYLANTEYEIISENEIIKEEKKRGKQFKVGDIVKGIENDKYDITNEQMTKGIVDAVLSNGEINITVLEHEFKSEIGCTYHYLDPQYFVLITSEEDNHLYHITTDMATFVEIEHGDFKAKSKCDIRYDKFDINIGIDIAMKRLEEAKKPEPPKPDIPKYVKYIGGSGKKGGLNNGDICKVYTYGEPFANRLYVSAKVTDFTGDCAVDPNVLQDKVFTYLYQGEYEPVNFNIYD